MRNVNGMPSETRARPRLEPQPEDPFAYAPQSVAAIKCKRHRRLLGELWQPENGEPYWEFVKTGPSPCPCELPDPRTFAVGSGPARLHWI